jgi:hypothetical protein
MIIDTTFEGSVDDIEYPCNYSSGGPKGSVMTNKLSDCVDFICLPHNQTRPPPNGHFWGATSLFAFVRSLHSSNIA